MWLDGGGTLIEDLEGRAGVCKLGWITLQGDALGET